MHIIVSLLLLVGTIIFLLSRIMRGAGDVVDAANEIGNLPRKLRYRKKAGKQGLDLVEDAMEAATILMIAVARLQGVGRVTNEQAGAIETELVTYMQLDRDEAEDLIINMRSLSQYLAQPESTLFPMLKILQNNVSKDEARELADMMRRVAQTDQDINTSQKNFIRRYEDRMGLLG